MPATKTSPKNLSEVAANVPSELCASSRWLNWFKIRNLKIALDAKTGRGAEKFRQDPRVWSTFDVAQKRVPRPTRARGWGLIVDSPFVAVDFDRCIEKHAVSDRVARILRQLRATYAEISPSGKGLHLWYRCPDHAKLPHQATVNFEVYAKGFLTVTGNKVSNAPATITELSLARALEIFRLADPQVLVAPTHGDDEPGYWDEEALVAFLTAWHKNIPGFEFHSRGDKFEVPCPGNGDGWSDGACHSTKDPVLSRTTMVWIRNGWPVFNCFHAHCAGKTWKSFQEYFDPLRIFFDFDAWQEAELKKLETCEEGHRG